MRFNRERLVALLNQHRFTAVIGLVIMIALIMTSISLSLYVSSGTLQLDLSRPGYESVRKEISSQSSEDFPATGPITTKTMDSFQKQYAAQRSGLNSISQFQDSALDDDSLDVLSTDTKNQ